MTNNNILKPTFLTKTELEWLLGNKSMSKSFEYKLKSTIKKKIDKFINFELPLLIQNQLLDKQLIQSICNNPNNILPILVRKRSRDQIPPKALNFLYERNKIKITK